MAGRMKNFKTSQGGDKFEIWIEPQSGDAYEGAARILIDDNDADPKDTGGTFTVSLPHTETLKSNHSYHIRGRVQFTGDATDVVIRAKVTRASGRHESFSKWFSSRDGDNGRVSLTIARVD